MLSWPISLSAQAPGTGARGLPQLGDGEDMSLAAEKKLGLRIARELYRDPDFIDDPLMSDYMQRIWQPLLSAAKARGDITPEMAREFAWELMIGKDKTVNAFALPGAYFGVHLGLISIVASRDELASVLAHELTHVAQRHIARSQSRQAQQAPWLMAAMILGSLALSKSPDAGSAVISGAQAAGVQSTLNYSRDMEREADRIGYSLHQEAGFDSQGFAGMFDKLAQASRINDNGSFPYLRSHPLTTERLGDMQARLQLQSPSVMSSNASLGLHAEHLLMAARARVLSETLSSALPSELSRADAALPQLTENSASVNAQLKAAAQVYAGAIAAVRLRQAEPALRYAQAALQAVNRVFLMAKTATAAENTAQLAIELVAFEARLLQTPAAIDQVQQSLERIQALAASNPDYARSALLARAQAAVALPQAFVSEPVIDALQSRVAAYPHDAMAWSALSQLYDLQNNSLRSLRAQAESHAALFDYTGALNRLKAAQELVRQNGATVNHVEASIIDTRTRQLQATLRELQQVR